MLAEGADFVVGVDTHVRRHAFAIIDARTGALLAEWKESACAAGYESALARCRKLAVGARLWALEGTGSYGAGLARHLAAAGESVREVERPQRRVARGG